MGSQNPDPTRVETQPEDPQIPPDPLLDSGTFIHVDDGDDDVTPAPPVPLQVLPPETESDSKTLALSETPKKSKRLPVEMAGRPDWLPEDWKIEIRMRTSGATAGTYDRYYISPTGKKFRSKTEVLHFMETGTTKKKKINADGLPPPSSEKLKTKKPKRQKVGDEGLTAEPVKQTWDTAFSCVTELEGKK